MRILDFKGFSALYEADQTISDETKSLIRRIVVTYAAGYGSMASLATDYADILKDLEEVIKANDEDKVATLKEISDKVSKAMSKEYQDAGVNTAWLEASMKTVEALETLIKQYEGDEAVLKVLYDDVITFVENYKDDLIKAKQEATKAQAAVKESEAINEGLFSTKKGNLKSLNQQAVALKAELEAAESDPALASFVSSKVAEVKDIIQRVAELQTAKRKEVDEKELETIGETLNKIPQDLNAQIEKVTKSNTANKEAARVYLQAIDLVDKAIEKEMEVTKKLQDTAAKAAEEAKKASRLSISKDLDPDNISQRTVNQEVKKFQELVAETFKDYAPFKDWELFQKFMNYGADGKFGNTTKAMVVALKNGYGLDDTSDVITQELITKMYEDPLKESASFIASFDAFNRVSEAFDPEKAKGSYTPPRSSGGGGSGTKEEEKKEEEKKEEEKKEEVKKSQSEIDSAVSEIEDLYIGGCKAIEALYDDTSYWKEYKGTFNDDEDVAVKDTFGSEYGSAGTWWKNVLRTKYVTKAWNLYHGDGKYAWLETEKPDVFEKLEGISNKFKTIYSELKRKTYGGTSDDDYIWSITLVDGTKKTFEVDTDF